jgi:hypothetical protein
MTLVWRTHFTEIQASRNPPDDAFTQAKFNPTANWSGKVGAGNMYRFTDVKVTVVMNGSASWVVAGKQDPVLLNHEQGHYTLTWLKARSLCRKLLEAEFDKTVLDVAKKPVDPVAYQEAQFRKMFADAQAEVDALNSLYDSRTMGAKDANGLIDTTFQKAWDKLIKYSLDNDTDPTLLVAMAGNPRTF